MRMEVWRLEIIHAFVLKRKLLRACNIILVNLLYAVHEPFNSIEKL